MSYSEENTYEKILDRALSNDALINVDKRVGSIIYDALAPVCLELANAYQKMDILEEQTYLMTATGKNLDRRVYDYGISRIQASQALRIGEFKKYKTDENGQLVLDEHDNPILVDMEIPIDSRFSVPEDDTVTFEYVGESPEGYKILQCEQLGTKGNEHIGTILPLSPISDLIEARITSTYKPAEDEEIDDDLRQRAKNHLNYLSYGGNISDYIEKVNSIDGVAQTKVFPAWRYNGSVLLSVVDSTFDPITPEFAQNLKEQIDPEESSGQGVGIAPIGHFVTITTPVKQEVKVSMTIETVVDSEIGEIKEEIENIVSEYFLEVRRSFAQNVKLAIYRARIVDKIFDSLSSVILNITDVMLNDMDADIVYVDEGQIGMQYLPYLSEVVIN